MSLKDFVEDLKAYAEAHKRGDSAGASLILHHSQMRDRMPLINKQLEDSDRPEYEGDGEPDLKSGEESKDEF